MRIRLSKRMNKKNFSRTASKTHKKNLKRKTFRGGIRL